MTDLTTYNRLEIALENAEIFKGGFGVYGRCSGVCCLF